MARSASSEHTGRALARGLSAHDQSYDGLCPRWRAGRNSRLNRTSRIRQRSLTQSPNTRGPELPAVQYQNLEVWHRANPAATAEQVAAHNHLPIFYQYLPQSVERKVTTFFSGFQLLAP